jgi:DNA primase
MQISVSFLQELRYRCDIEQIVSRYVNLRKSGHTLTGLCPFHNEKTPSFSVSIDKQVFHCFGCGAGGDVINFIRKIENLDFIDSVKFLAEQAGLEIPEEQADKNFAMIRERVLAINREAARYFYNCLQSDIGKEGLEYLNNRGLTSATIHHFGIGFAPNSWDSLSLHLSKLGYSQQEMKIAAVSVQGKNNGIYDQFRNRIIFPIIDVRGNVIAFGGRVMDDSKPKYLNSGATPVFNKSANLFALNFAKNNNNGSLILAEGYMDVVSMHQAGFNSSVATLGTSITPEQARIMSRYAKEVIIAYDSDQAGQAATNKAIALLTDVGLSVKVLKIEDGKDPDEYIKKHGAERFKLMLQKSGGYIEYKIAKVRAKYNLDISEQKVDFIKEVISILAELDSNIEREVYAGKLSLEVDISKDVLLKEAKTLAEKNNKAKNSKEIRKMTTESLGFNDRINPEKHKFFRASQAEEGLISLLIANPDFLEFIQKRIIFDDFLTAFNRRVFEKVCFLIKNSNYVDLSIMGAEFSADEMGRITKIMLKNTTQKNNFEEALDYINVIKDENAKQNAPSSANMDATELSDYIKILASKKNSGGRN